MRFQAYWVFGVIEEREELVAIFDVGDGVADGEGWEVDVKEGEVVDLRADFVGEGEESCCSATGTWRGVHD